jgi:hypothetical protein
MTQAVDFGREKTTPYPHGGDTMGGLRAWSARNRYPLLAIAPVIVVLFLLTIFPTVYALYISLFNFDLPRPQLSSFLGIGNFAEVVTDSRFWVSLLQTLILMISAVGIEFIVGLALALFFFEDFRGKSVKSIYLPMILIPMMIAPVLVGYIWRLLYQVQFGPLNYMLSFLGLGPLEWTSSTSLALGRAAAFLDLGDEALAPLPVAAMHQNARTGLAKPLRNQATDAVRRAGDQRGLAVQSRHAGPPSLIPVSNMV